MEASEKVPVALKAWVKPLALVVLEGEMAMELRVAGVTVKVTAELVTVPKDAVIWVVPAANA